jgi:hypothetical protein
MVKLTEEQKKVMLLLNDPEVDPDLVSTDLLNQLIGLRLVCRGGTNHLELTDRGEAVLTELQAAKS